MADETKVQLDGAQVKLKEITCVLSHFQLLISLTCILNKVFLSHWKCTTYPVAELRSTASLFS